jgi:hypothetical protein
MKNATVEYAIPIFPRPILPTVQGDPEYHTIHSIRKLLHANVRSIETHLGGGALSHLGIIISITAYTTIVPTHPWENPTAPEWAPAEVDGGTAARLAAERYCWEEAVVTFRTWNSVKQALKKQIIAVFEPMYLKSLNNDMVGFANTTARDMLEHMCLYYGSITVVDLEQNF